MSYVSIVKKLQDRYNQYMREAYTNLDLYNSGDWDGDTSYMFSAADRVAAKIEKVKRLMQIEVFEFVEYYLSGQPFVLQFKVAVNGKMLPKWFYWNDLLPNGTKVELFETPQTL